MTIKISAESKIIEIKIQEAFRTLRQVLYIFSVNKFKNNLPNIYRQIFNKQI